MNKLTILSPDNAGPDGRGKYRYTLWRDVRELTTPNPEGFVMFIGVNPSTADEVNDDATIRKCKKFARSFGVGWLLMTNLFALRARNPKVMLGDPAPIGPDNDLHLRNHAFYAERIVCAWGKPGAHLGRDNAVCRLLPPGLWCLRKNADGSPEHPLYIPDATALRPWP